MIPQPPVASPSSSGLDTWEPPAPPAELAPGPARVPSCDLVGLTLHNFALYDLNGQPWEFRQRYGKLVLLDFWGTWCIPCLHAVPHLKDMQLRYGPYGLQVVGIAYEEGTPQQQVEKINRVRTRLQMNYLVLRGAERSQCPVCTQFQVRQWPTLVLLDERGRIIWRGEGVDAQKLKDLEIVIRQRLNLR